MFMAELSCLAPIMRVTSTCKWLGFDDENWPGLSRRRAFDGEPREQKAADKDAVPGKDAEAVLRHEGDEALHHEIGDDERDRKADRQDEDVLDVQLRAMLVERVDRCTEHSRDREEERELRRCAALDLHQQRAHDRRTRA